MTIRFGEPLDFSRFAGMEHEDQLRAVTDEIIYAILTLSGQEYVDEYAVRQGTAGGRAGGAGAPVPAGAVRVSPAVGRSTPPVAARGAWARRVTRAVVIGGDRGRPGVRWRATAVRRWSTWVPMTAGMQGS